MKECLLICKSMYILKVFSIYYTLRQIFLKFGQNKRNVPEMLSFFVHGLQFITVLSLICDSLMS